MLATVKHEREGTSKIFLKQRFKNQTGPARCFGSNVDGRRAKRRRLARYEQATGEALSVEGLPGSLAVIYTHGLPVGH